MKLLDRVTESYIDLREGTMTVGRNDENDITLPPGENRIALYGAISGPVILGQTVSRRHAKIHSMEWGVYIEDVGSTMGTVVNSEPVAKGALREIKPGDMIRLGHYELEVRE